MIRSIYTIECHLLSRPFLPAANAYAVRPNHHLKIAIKFSFLVKDVKPSLVPSEPNMIQMKCKTRMESQTLTAHPSPRSSELVAHILIPQQPPPDPTSRPICTLARRIIRRERPRAGHLLIRHNRIIPPLRPTLTHDIEMRPKPVLIPLRALATTPLLIPIRRTEVGDHDGDGVACTGAVALARGGDVVGVGELVAGAAAGAAPGARAAEEGLRARGREERGGGVRGGLPGGEGAVGAAAAGAFLAVVVVL